MSDPETTKPPALSSPDMSEGSKIGLRTPVTIGLGAILIFFGIFGGWAALAPLDSAAIAPGIVSVDTSRKTVQHLEGGIVDEILVRDGDQVSAGQILIRLEKTQPESTLDLLKARLITAASREGRLITERDGKKEIEFPAWFEDEGDRTQTSEAIISQKNILVARRNAIRGQTAILEQRIAQINEEIVGLRGEIDSQVRQLALIEEELVGVRELVEKQLTRKTRLLELERRAAVIEGEKSRNEARIARAGQQIGETQLQISELGTRMMNEVLVELRDVQSELSELTERIRAAKDVLRRTEIRATLDGTVVGLSVHTAGGVIGPGQALLDIVPSQDRLVIEARIDPSDIDVIQPGLPANIRLTAFNQRDLVPLAGTVTRVSADLLTDQRTGLGYYLARVEIDPGQTEVLDDLKLYPGMQAEVMIVTGRDTALNYLLKPIGRTLRRAFREK